MTLAGRAQPHQALPHGGAALGDFYRYIDTDGRERLRVHAHRRLWPAGRESRPGEEVLL